MGVPEDVGTSLDCILSLLFPILMYVAVTIFVFWQLVPEQDGVWNVFIWEFDTKFPLAVKRLVYSSWFFISLVLPVLALFVAQGPRRILLVVDDLDRCEPRQMLEIIESIMLLLDDKEIQKRMQIAMLVEEEAIHTALLMKYEHLRLPVVGTDRFDSKIDDRIVRENIEKIFVSYLRLPEIPPE